jgi:hypothetical protein
MKETIGEINDNIHSIILCGIEQYKYNIPDKIKAGKRKRFLFDEYFDFEIKLSGLWIAIQDAIRKYYGLKTVQEIIEQSRGE